MAFPPLASIEELTTWLELTSINVPRADAILTAASTLIRTHTGRMWVDAAGDFEAGVDPIKLDAVHTVCLTVAARVYDNPTGETQSALGAYSSSVAAWSALGLALTDDEKAMIGGGNSSGIPGLSSIRVVAPAAAAGVSRSTTWCDDDDDEDELGS